MPGMSSTLRTLSLGAAAAISLTVFSSTVLASPAAASTPADALGAALQAAPSPPEVAISCAPAGDVLGLLATVAVQAGGNTPDDATLAALMSGPAGLAALGVAVDDPLVLTMWDPTGEPVGELDLPFSGDAAEAHALLVQLGLAPKAVPDTPGTWVTNDGGTDTTVRLLDDHLALSFNGPPPEQTGLVSPDLDLIAGLPADRGCAAWVATTTDKLPAMQRIGGDDGLALAGFLPFERGGIGLIRIRAAMPLPAALSTSGRAPVTGSSAEPPAMVFSIGLSMADLLEDSDLIERMDLKQAQARKLQRYANIGSGSTVAFFGDPRRGDFAAALPLDGTRGPTRAHKVARRLRKLARKAGLDVLRSEDRSLVVQAKDTLVFIEVRDGRVYLAAHGPRAVEAADGQGNPWVSSDDLSWALQWPVALWTGPRGPSAQQFSLKVQGGLRGVDDVFEVGVRVQTDAPPGFIGSFVTGLLGQQLSKPAVPTDTPPDPDGAAGGGDEPVAP